MAISTSQALTVLQTLTMKITEPLGLRLPRAIMTDTTKTIMDTINTGPIPTALTLDTNNLPTALDRRVTMPTITMQATLTKIIDLLHKLATDSPM